MSYALKLLNEIDLHSTMDAREWAKEFCKVTGFHDEEWAFGWFANAIMKGWDSARVKYDPELQKNLENFLQSKGR